MIRQGPLHYYYPVVLSIAPFNSQDKQLSYLLDPSPAITHHMGSSQQPVISHSSAEVPASSERPIYSFHIVMLFSASIFARSTLHSRLGPSSSCLCPEP